MAPRKLPFCIIRRFFRRKVFFIDSALRFCLLRRSLVFCRTVSGTFAKHVFCALANAVEKFLATLFNVFSLCLFSQFIYTLQHRQESSHTITHDQVTCCVARTVFYFFPVYDRARVDYRTVTTQVRPTETERGRSTAGKCVYWRRRRRGTVTVGNCRSFTERCVQHDARRRNDDYTINPSAFIYSQVHLLKL